METVRMGVVGVGNMGTAHCNWIVKGEVPGMTLGAVCDINPARLEWARANLPEDVARFDDAEAMFRSGKIDAAIIATPHYLHPPLVIAALNAGLHVISEKPAGVYTKQVREMNEAAAKSDRVFALMYNQRTDPLYRKMKELVDSGEFGALKRSNWIITNWYRSQAYYDSGSWRATWAGEGGGVLINQCPHNIDLWQWICGLPVKVRGFCHEGLWHDIEVEDDVTAYVEYENGATGVFVTCTADAPGTNRLELTLDGGKMVSEDGRLHVWKLDAGEREFNRTNTVPFGSPKAAYQVYEFENSGPQHVGVLRQFAGAVLRGEPLVARGEEGIRGLSLSNAIHLSSWLGHPVDMPVDENLYYDELKKRIAVSRLKPEGAAVVSDTAGSYNTAGGK